MAHLINQSNKPEAGGRRTQDTGTGGGGSASAARAPGPARDSETLSPERPDPERLCVRLCCRFVSEWAAGGPTSPSTGGHGRSRIPDPGPGRLIQLDKGADVKNKFIIFCYIIRLFLKDIILYFCLLFFLY